MIYQWRIVISRLLGVKLILYLSDVQSSRGSETAAGYEPPVSFDQSLKLQM
jgi:hypothetical protein